MTPQTAKKMIRTLTHSGRMVPLNHPEVSDIELRDIAEGLSKQCRFNGQCDLFYSVAQHSVVCLAILRTLPEFQDLSPLLRSKAEVYVLLHDAHEAYIGDVINPVKAVLISQIPTFEKKWGKLTQDIDKAIFESFGLPLPTPQMQELVNKVDQIALATELVDLWHEPPSFVHEMQQRAHIRIVPKDWSRALTEFMAAVETVMRNPYRTRK